MRNKSYRFALGVIEVHRELMRRREYILGRQLLKAGTSIGANVEEALAGQSRRDFLAKMTIASKEAREADYWLRLFGTRQRSRWSRSSLYSNSVTSSSAS